MSKKKRFAGKKTKLAKHALTQVLEQVQAEAPPLPAAADTLAQAVQTLRQDQLPLQFSLPSDISLDQRLPLSPQHCYLAVLSELHELRDFLRRPEVPPRPRQVGVKPAALPEAGVIAYALDVIVHTLRGIRTLLD